MILAVQLVSAVKLLGENMRLGTVLLLVFLPLWASLAEAQQQPLLDQNTNSPAVIQPPDSRAGEAAPESRQYD